MARQALIVGRAAGPDEQVAEVLTRFGFTRTHRVEDVAAAIEQLRQTHVDLVIVPLDGIADLQLAAFEREIRRERFTAVIGTAPKQEPELMLRAMRAGIQEFLVSPPEPKDLAAAVDRLMRRTMSTVQRGEIITVYSAKGGLGTSTVSANLAHGFAKNHPGVTIGATAGVIGFGACAMAVDKVGTCAIIGGSAALVLGGITGLVTMFADTNAHELPPFEEGLEDNVIRTQPEPPPGLPDAGVLPPGLTDPSRGAAVDAGIAMDAGAR